MLRWISTMLLPFQVLAASFLVQDSQLPLNEDVKVPVHLGVMSRCPDALLCESIFDKVLTRVGGKVDLSLVYVGRLDDSEPDFGVQCKHGPVECAGNVQQLCIAKYATFNQWWEFVQCQNYQGKENIGKPETALKCARSALFDWDGQISQCVGEGASGKGEEGVALLHESVKLGKSMGIEKSCTILINGREVCIRDETWRNCEEGHTANDFIRQINNEYERINSNGYGRA
ncbi:hypothetical protein EV421DRAFT_1765376 [Armillaria borealis]|uniref:Gamma interferon inducible lysosomal thiol reductase GILT n=1 Tax=Armillaria borealis TaxID=47425 RepID=A0AA39N146_9AGAR|nr:hypothetical protein EV421DRAFT_1765376 [Armillaria borealis]